MKTILSIIMLLVIVGMLIMYGYERKIRDMEKQQEQAIQLIVELLVE